MGTAGLIVGVSITLGATAARSPIGLFLGMVVAGVGFASGFQGAIRSVLPLASAEHRAGVLSVIYLVSYLALSLPAIIAGVVVVSTGSLKFTARGYGIAVIVLAALAFAGLARRGRAQTAHGRGRYWLGLEESKPTVWRAARGRVSAHPAG